MQLSFAELQEAFRAHGAHIELCTLDFISLLSDLRILRILSGSVRDSCFEEIIKTVHLEVLVIRNVQLNTLPTSIGRLTNLQHLDLSYNNIKTLPVELFALQKIKYIDLSNNQLSYEQVNQLEKHFSEAILIY